MSSSPPPAPAQQTHITAAQNAQSILDATVLANGRISTVAATCAVGVVHSFVQCYSPDDVTNVFVVCGPGFNGLVGLHVALELKARDYVPAVYTVGESVHANFGEICQENGLDLYDFVPSTLDYNFEVVVDALLGTSYDGEDIRPHMWDIYGMLVSTRLAIVSVDVPSGWDLEKGPRKIDVTADTFVKPEVLVSLGAPKKGSKMFAGGYHFVAGRHLDQEYFEKLGIRVPVFPGSESHCVLLSSNPFRHQGDNGERYGKPGQYNATLYTKNPEREWVDIDDDVELWDEFD